VNNHEISFTRFGPSANLARRVDENHEELKGRNLSWLIYLNEKDWNADVDGRCLRTYERKSPWSKKVGSRHGDPQIGWLAPLKMINATSRIFRWTTWAEW